MAKRHPARKARPIAELGPPRAGMEAKNRSAFVAADLVPLAQTIAAAQSSALALPSLAISRIGQQIFHDRIVRAVALENRRSSRSGRSISAGSSPFGGHAHGIADQNRPSRQAMRPVDEQGRAVGRCKLLRRGPSACYSPRIAAGADIGDDGEDVGKEISAGCRLRAKIRAQALDHGDVARPRPNSP